MLRRVPRQKAADTGGRRSAGAQTRAGPGSAAPAARAGPGSAAARGTPVGRPETCSGSALFVPLCLIMRLQTTES